MAARAKAIPARPLERLHERIVTGDRVLFFAGIADKGNSRSAASR